MTGADYHYYSTQFGGDMDEGEFRRCARIASALLCSFTGGRCETEAAEPYAEEMRLALCSVAEEIRSGGLRAVVSASNDGCSETYGDGRSAKRRLYDIAATYLSQTGLLYAGV